ncbi:nucleotide-binding domain containing protein [Klebsiella pneumoniae]
MRDILPVVVDGLWRQGAKNLAVRLVSAEGQPLPAWTPGAHIDLHLPCGLIRQYSLTGSPAERDRYLLCIARESQSRGGSRYIHDTLRPGQPLIISAPRNHFPLHEGGHVVLLAAGIGITPLLAMAHARAASGASFTLHYYVSRAQEAAFATEIARQLTGGICQIHCSDEGQSPRQRLAQDLGAPDADTRVYFCGPPGFMARVRDTARAVGWEEAQLHSSACFTDLESYVRTLTDWVDAQRDAPLAPMIYATTEPQTLQRIQAQYGDKASSERVEQLFAALAAALKTKGFTRFIVAGGETSSIVAQTLGVEAFHIGPTISPGVPWVRDTRQPLSLALKSGNFGDIQFFARAQQEFRHD